MTSHVPERTKRPRPRTLAALIAATVLAIVAVAPAGAITGDFKEDFDHPFVGTVVFWTDWFYDRCSGSLVAPTVFVTAGHCVAIDRLSDEDGPTRAFVYLQQDPQPTYDGGFDPDPVTGFPQSCAPATLGIECATSGTMYDYGFTDANVKDDYHDVGVVILDQAIALPAYGTLPAPHELDTLMTERGTQEATFTISGYGFSYVPGGRSGDVVSYVQRLEATAIPVSLGDAWSGYWGVLIEGHGLDQGSVCFRDSGGPMFWPPDSNQVAAIHSQGIGNDQRCRGVAREYRLDQQAVIDWILEVAGDAADDIVVGD